MSTKVLFQNFEFGRYSIGPALEAARKCHDLTIEQNNDGRIVAIEYGSGAQVRVNALYTIARSEAGALWMGNNDGIWHPLD
ncbi:MAG TPA: hypothetical protein PKZ32_12965 [Candidatus Melainabacteria bacterium]|nr:hypothetical protein [Candidatus Melainabacteria bacterium]